MADFGNFDLLKPQESDGTFDDMLWTLLERDYELQMDESTQKELIDSIWNMDPNQSATIVNLDEEAEALGAKKSRKQSNKKNATSKQSATNSTDPKNKASNPVIANANGTVTTTKPAAPRCPRLRIFKNDIRRSYTFMVANVLNSIDFNYMRGFFKRFAVPQIGFIMSHDPCGVYDTLYNPNFLCNLAGSEAIACYLGVLTYSTPDYIFSVRDTKIKVRSDCPGSVITCQYEGTGTFQYECTLEAIATDLLQAFAQFSNKKEGEGETEAGNGEQEENKTKSDKEGQKLSNETAANHSTTPGVSTNGDEMDVVGSEGGICSVEDPLNHTNGLASDPTLYPNNGSQKKRKISPTTSQTVPPPSSSSSSSSSSSKPPAKKAKVAAKTTVVKKGAPKKK